MEAVTGSSSGGAGSDCEGEEQEDPSPCSLTDVQNVNAALNKLTITHESPQNKAEDVLSAFRQQWQQELVSTSSPQHQLSTVQKPRTQQPPADIEPVNDEDKAKQLFRRGIELERSGMLYEAVQHYKRAVQIVPDVERRLYESSDTRDDTPEVDSGSETESGSAAGGGSGDEAGAGRDLVAKFQRILARRGSLCEPKHPQKSTHISWLPYELILAILRWVVSSELDAASLERLGATCRGMYLAARDDDIWRAMCVRTWGVDCSTPKAAGFGSWRGMFVSRPRLRLNGCYISKTSYLRHGENSFQDQFYRPWYLIDYYRYLRFFPDGLVLMWTTADEPAACVAHLRQRATKHAAGILQGHYRLIGDKVIVVVKKAGSDKKLAQSSNTRFRARRKDSLFETHEQIFHMELQVRPVRRRRNWQLVWRVYSVCSRRDQWTSFELTAAKFPPFAFSPVRTYTAEADAPLD